MHVRGSNGADVEGRCRIVKQMAQEVLGQVDRLIEETRPEDIPALSMALSARVSVATARLLEALPEPQPVAVNGLLTVAELATRLKIGKARAYELIRQGNLPCIRVGANQIRVSEATLTKWLAQREH